MFQTAIPPRQSDIRIRTPNPRPILAPNRSFSLFIVLFPSLISPYRYRRGFPLVMAPHAKPRQLGLFPDFLPHRGLNPPWIEFVQDSRPYLLLASLRCLM